MVEMSTDEDSGIVRTVENRDHGLRFLLVEDSATDAYLVQTYLNQGLHTAVSVHHVETVAEAIESLERHRFDLVLLDLTLPDSAGIATFYSIFAQAENVPILILSGDEGDDLAVIAVRDGAQDYMLKGELSAHTLGLEVRFAMERNKRLTAERQLDVAHEQIRIARQLQKKLYPRSAPQVEGFDIAGYAWAAEHACGDYFDFLPMQDGTVGIVVGDVSGHGLGPALKMVETRAALHAFSQYEHNLGKLIAAVHRVFCGGENLMQRGLFLTLFIGRLDAANRILHYSSAGHQAFQLTAAGDVRVSVIMDYPIGIVDEMGAEKDQQFSLENGDIVVIPTDGFYEVGARQSELFGVERMLAVVHQHRCQSAADIVRAMYDAARNHVPGTAQEDDMAAIVIKVD